MVPSSALIAMSYGKHKKGEMGMKKGNDVASNRRSSHTLQLSSIIKEPQFDGLVNVVTNSR